VSASSHPRVFNLLISQLSQQDSTRLCSLCEPVNLTFGTSLCEPDQPYQHVYFPLTAFVLLVEKVTDHEPLEMGLIGNEGMLGATIALGVHTAPLRGVVQGSGTALRMTAMQFRQELKQSTLLLSTVCRYLYIALSQLSQTAACNRFHEVEARLVRLLLMIHDRAHKEHFHFTHKFLADMLGVQRSAVTIAAGMLQKRDLICYTRGEITIVDRQGLEAMSCECYLATVEDYCSLLPL
jgi:hypothetical protein